MTTDKANRLELARISPEMTQEEAFQALVAALERPRKQLEYRGGGEYKLPHPKTP